MKMKCIIMLLLCLTLAFSSALAEGEISNDAKRLAGWYVSFDEGGQAVLNRGIIDIQNGMINNIQPYREGEADVIYLDEDCIIFPGLIDLHSHMTYNYIQLIEFQENTAAPWDNRFEWRETRENQNRIEDKKNAVTASWPEPYNNSNVLTGDLIDYFLEFQAAAGGTTLIQINPDKEGVYDQEDFHQNVRLIRATGDASDLGTDRPVISLGQIFVPDPALSSEDPLTYLPPQDTSGWGIANVPDRNTRKPSIEVILDNIRRNTGNGYLIHLSEGRAGNIQNSADAYSRLEFETLKKYITEGVDRGDFTIRDVRNAHINLIHGCAVDLDSEEDYKFISNYGIGLVWSPVSNLLLYEDTPDFYDFLTDTDIMIALGSDWSPSGSKTVWDECKFAFNFAPINVEDLLRACTLTPARMIGNDKFGNIQEGRFADFFILKGMDQAALQSALDLFIEADDNAVEGVIVGGQAIYGEESLLKAFGNGTYGQYAGTSEKLNAKYLLIPDIFEGTSLQTLWQDYSSIIQKAGIDFSEIRTSEDDVYRQDIEALGEKFSD